MTQITVKHQGNELVFFRLPKATNATPPSYTSDLYKFPFMTGASQISIILTRLWWLFDSFAILKDVCTYLTRHIVIVCFEFLWCHCVLSNCAVLKEFGSILHSCYLVDSLAMKMYKLCHVIDLLNAKKKKKKSYWFKKIACNLIVQIECNFNRFYIVATGSQTWSTIHIYWFASQTTFFNKDVRTFFLNYCDRNCSCKLCPLS